MSSARRRTIAVCAGVVTGLLSLLLLSGHAAAFSQEDFDNAGDAYGEAINDLAAKFQDPALTPAQLRFAIASTRAAGARARRDTAKLVPDDAGQRRYQQIGLTLLDEQISILDDALDGTIDGQQFVSRWSAAQSAASTAIEKLSKGVEEQGDGSGLPWPVDQWWFWVFVAPEALILVGSILIYVIGGAGYGAGALWRRLRRETT